MATLAYGLTVGNERYSGGPAANSSSAAVALLAAVDAAITAATAIGAGDASAEVAAVRAAYDILATAVNATPPSATGDAVLIIDTGAGKITTMNKLKNALDAFYRLIDGSGLAKG